jgi:hypothetical protein
VDIHEIFLCVEIKGTLSMRKFFNYINNLICFYLIKDVRRDQNGVFIATINVAAQLSFGFWLSAMLVSITWFLVTRPMVMQMKASLLWPTTDGIITDPVRPCNHNISLVSDELCVGYTYEVKGKSYHNNKLRFGKYIWERIQQNGSFQELVDNYPPNIKVTVFYNPKDPGDSVIIPGGNSDMSFMWYLDLFLGIITFASFLGKETARISFRNKRTNHSTKEQR